MTEPLAPTVGWGVLHLFCKLSDHPDGTPGAGCDPDAVVRAVEAAGADDVQVVTVAMLGHKADLGVMALGPDLWRLRRLQSDLQAAGLTVVDSYVSLTEVSEYAGGVPDEMKQTRLHPRLPPEGKTAFCFYPMSKRRGDAEGANWFALPFDERKELMYGHGASGRTFAGRIVQVITGSTGIDDWEWGVTLFGVHPDDLKECVYTMRFDEASARFAEFGPFLTGMVAPVEEVLAQVLPGHDRTRTRRPGRGPGSRVGRRPRRTACRPGRPRRRGGGLQRRGRLGLSGHGGHRHPRGRPRAVRDGRVAVARPRGAGRLPGAGRGVGAPPPRGGHRRAGRPGLRGQRRRALLPLQVALMTALDTVVGAAGAGATVVLGVNVDDLSDHRPGQSAAAERGAVFPLVAAGFTKADVREWSRRLGLRTWDKPAAACLASRVPYGTPVTFATLDTVARAESGLRELGFRQLRVRHYGDTARIEVPTADLAEVVARREAVSAAVHAAGYRYVTVDLDGFRSGNLNGPPAADGSAGSGGAP